MVGEAGIRKMMARFLETGSLDAFVELNLRAHEVPTKEGADTRTSETHFSPLRINK